MARKQNFYETPRCISAPSFYRGVMSKTISTLPWVDAVRLICEDKGIAEAIAACRQALDEGDNELYASLKKQLPAITPAAVFDFSRNADSLVALTGVSLCDFDHIAADQMQLVKAKAASDPHTFMLFETPSGHGLRTLYKFSSEQQRISYSAAWQTGNLYYSALLGLPYDKACSDVTRLSFLSHDENCYFNPDAIPFVIDTQPAEPDRHHSVSVSDAAAIVERAQALLQRQGIVYVEGNRHSYLIQLCIVLRKWGLSNIQCFDALDPLAPRGSIEARDIVEWVCGKVDEQLTEAPAPKAKMKNHDTPPVKSGDKKSAEPVADQVISFLLGRNIRFNQVSASLEIYDPDNHRFVELTDRDANSLWISCCKHLQREVSTVIFDRILNADIFPVVDPFADYFAHLPQWDGADHIGALAATVHTTAPVGLFECSFRHWLVGMAAGWLSRGSCNQIILTLIGAQGLFKSTFFRLLLPPELSRYFLAKSNSSYLSKDDKIAAASYGLIDFEELDSLREADLNSIKALVSIETISERATYARNRENRRRIASFCATGNNKQFLTDLTGNRRWHPFEVSAIDCPYDHPICYDQLYAQVLHMIDCGYNYWFSKQEDLAMESYKSSFSEPCCEEELLLRYFRKPVGGEAFTQFLSVTEIATICSLGQRSSLSNRRMSQSLQRLGFRPARVHNKRGYLVVKLTTDEINEQTNKMTRTAISGEQEEIF